MSMLLSVVAQSRRRAIDREAGLTLTSTHAVGSTFVTDGRTNPVVFATDLIIPVNPVGLIYEGGANIRGAYVGFRSDGTLVIRCGNGGELPQTDAAAILVAGVTGAGKLVWEFNPSTRTARAWWRGTLLGSNTSANPFPASEWAGADTSGYFAVGGSGAAAGEVVTPLSSAGASTLRRYANQTVA